jgi:DNA-binding PadR family transcriptional regulator
MILTKKQFDILKELNKSKNIVGPELRKKLKWGPHNDTFYLITIKMNKEGLLNKERMESEKINIYSITEYGRKCLKETAEFYKL